MFAGMALGKPIGAFVFGWLAVRVGLVVRPVDLDWFFLGAGALLTGIGVTVSLFIASLAYSPAILDAAKVGILGAFVALAAGGLLALSRRKRDS